MNIFLTLIFFLVFQNDLGSSECPDNNEYDYIIVGGGSTGGVIATRLSEDSNVTVLLLEAGGEPSKNASIPLLAFDLVGTEMNWNYTSTRQEHSCDIFKDRIAPLHRGKVLGGTGSVDAMLYLHGNKRDYDSWRDAGNAGWGYEDILPYFRKLENFIFPHDPDSDSYHGIGGPITVSHSDFKTKSAEAFMAAASEIGQPIVDSNGKTQIGFSYAPSNMANGSRCNSYACYLKPAMSRSNLKVLTHALATKIVINSEKRATGVEYTTKCTKDNCEKECTVNANKEVIISGGVYNTPQLLMLSGIGPKEALKKFEIDVVADLPGVGQNLQEHVSVVGQLYTLNDTVSLNKKRYDTKKYLDQWYTDKTGPMTVGAAFEADCFYQSKLVTNATDYPDIEVFFNSDNMVPIFKDYLDPAVLASMPSPDKDTVTFGPLVLRPKSRGFVTLRSKNPHDPPIINPNYLSHQDDVATLVEAIKFSWTIARANAFKKYDLKLPLGGVVSFCAAFPVGSDEYFECVARKLSLGTFHVTSSSKMGPASDSMAVVDNTLRVHGLKNLRLADASIMPNMVSAHPIATCFMIGEKVSDMIKQDARNN